MEVHMSTDGLTNSELYELVLREWFTINNNKGVLSRELVRRKNSGDKEAKAYCDLVSEKVENGDHVDIIPLH